VTPTTAGDAEFGEGGFAFGVDLLRCVVHQSDELLRLLLLVELVRIGRCGLRAPAEGSQEEQGDCAQERNGASREHVKILLALQMAQA
jgi:hypothetical protein